MGVTEGVLVLLASGPRHGYQLKQEFERATGGAWTLNVGQVYGALQRLERAELIAPVDDETGTDPAESDADGGTGSDGRAASRKRYRCTPAGEERARRWLFDEPVEHSPARRDEVAMKVLLAARTPGTDPREVVARQRTVTMAALQALTRRKAAAGRPPPLEEVLHLDRVILRCRAELDWLDLVEQRLDDRDGRGDAPQRRDDHEHEWG